jgi:hypothetical protein
MAPFVEIVLTYFVALIVALMAFHAPTVSGWALLGIVVPAISVLAAFGLLQRFEHDEEPPEEEDALPAVPVPPAAAPHAATTARR